MFEKNGHSVSFRTGEEIALFDYATFAMIEAPTVKKGSLFISSDFADKIQGLFDAQSNESLFKVGAILIDPGHGGKDPGAVAEHTINGKKVTVCEKDITLAASKKLYSQLQKEYPDKKIVLTRSDDRYLSLEERVSIANSLSLAPDEAVLYLSIHVNSAFDKKAAGFEVWYLSPGYRRTVISEDEVDDASLRNILNSMMEEEYTTESILIAKYIQDGLNLEIGDKVPNRGIKQEEWFVVRNANMPSVLVELGFVSNPAEAALMVDDAYLNKMVSGIYNGLVAFVTHFEQSRGFTGLQER
ncbi:MAG: N-acetylmuramoyl-L-alanine amidase [Treponema sp.]|nr:N-acetylmuramoyl-L-alanine amidase [Candidatus Treponema caballi]